MNPRAVRTTLFVTFLAIFVATAVLTLLAIAGVVHIDEGYLKALFASLILEIVAAMLALFRSASFFSGDDGAEAQRIVGAWCQFVRNKPGVALSLVHVRTTGKAGRLRLDGEAFDEKGVAAGDWRSFVAWLDPDTLQLVYLWTGSEASLKGGDLTGLGIVGFQASEAARVTRGFGWFVAPGTPVADDNARVLAEWRRCSDADGAIVAGDDAAARAQLAATMLARG